MKSLLLTLCVSLAFVAPVFAKDKLGKAEKAAIAASSEQVADLVEVKSDSLDTHVRLSSEPFYKQKGIFGNTSGDKFLRAMIDKRSGATVVQLYMWFTYSGEWLFIDRMNYIGPDGLKSIKGHKVDSDVGSCSAYGCLKTEHVVFTIPSADLEFASKDAQAGVNDQWQFKLFGRYENGQTTGILKTEIAGMLLAVARESSKLVPASENPTSAKGGVLKEG